MAVTNLHVLKYAQTAVAKSLDQGVTYSVARVEGFSRRRDVCLIRLATSACQSAGAPDYGPPCGLPARTSLSLAVGDEIYVAGTPKGLEGTFSKGMVTGLRSEPSLVQIDAPVSPGSSGGPLLNGAAEVIGVVVSTLVGGQNLNFAVPIDDLSSLGERSVNVREAGGIAVYDKESEGLQGNVRSVKTSYREFGFDRNSGKYYEEPAKTELLEEYDTRGNKAKLEIRDLNTGKVNALCWVFDADDLLAATGGCDSVSPVQKTSVVSRMSRLFGDQVEVPLGPGSSMTSRYSARGLTEELTLDSPAAFTRTLYSYTSERRISEVREFERGGELRGIRRIVYQNDPTGNWVLSNETWFSPKYERLGWTPSARTYREFRYYE
ncbi:MAG: S1C family serine protease [Acidobacteriia bacterium]|nr:S1C family serine protease [Terriglobia bacterium]